MRWAIIDISTSEDRTDIEQLTGQLRKRNDRLSDLIQLDRQQRNFSREVTSHREQLSPNRTHLINLNTPLSRRMFLRGTGVALALPWFETFAGVNSKDETPKRFLSVLSSGWSRACR